MRAGAAKTEITPPVGGQLVGPQKASTGVHDSLFAKALYVDDGTNPWVLVSFDLMALDYGICDRMREAIRERTGAAEVVLNCTHTHSAPFSAPWSVPVFEQHCREEGEWREQLVRAIPDMAAAARDRAAPVSLHVGRAPVAIGFNRRLLVDGSITMLPNYHAPTAPWVDVIEARGEDGRPVAVVFSHAAHPVIVHMASTELSADYPGYAAAGLREELGEDGVFMFCQGCGANINGYPLATGQKNAARAGRKLAEAVMQAMSDSVQLESPTFTVASESVALPCEDIPPLEELDKMIAENETQLKQEGDGGSWWLADRIGGIKGLRADKLAGKPRTVRMDLAAITCGTQWGMVALANEAFCEYALRIDRESPFDTTMVLGYSHGDESYVPTDEALELKGRSGYEASSFPHPGAASFCYPLRLSLKPGSEELVHQAVHRLWEA